MDQQNILKESLENLYQFEYFSFRKKFSIVLIIIGIVNLVFYTLTAFFYDNFREIIGPHSPTIRFIIFFIVFSYIFYNFYVLKRTKFEDGSIINFRSKRSPMLIILGFILFTPLGDVFLMDFFENNFPLLIVFAPFIYTFFVILIYHQIHSDYFPIEESYFMKKFGIVTIIVGIISFIIIFLIDSLFEGIIFLHRENLYEYLSAERNQSIFLIRGDLIFQYFSIVNGIMLCFFGLIDYIKMKHILGTPHNE